MNVWFIVLHYFCLQSEKDKRLQTEKIRIAMNKLKEARVKKASIVSCSRLLKCSN